MACHAGSRNMCDAVCTSLNAFNEAGHVTFGGRVTISCTAEGGYGETGSMFILWKS